TVTLTEAGAAEVNAGTDLPAFNVTAKSTTGQTSVSTPVEIDPAIDTNEPITLTMTAPPVFVEDATAAGDVVTTVDTVNDPDGADYRYSIDDSVNYAIDAATGTVTLTQAGADLVNAGTDLPAFNVTAKSTTGQTSVRYEYAGRD
ncbi:hypothetical protein, partial [Psychrobacter sp. APC 3350]|uniref:hypothetical protein n=1 Tax=Psychrobacter sp. APC 3350 TaxID=3035195 RepID=UPI0025B3EF03